MTFIETTGYGLLVSVQVHPRIKAFARIPFFSEQSDLFDYRAGRVCFPGPRDPEHRIAVRVRARALRAMDRAGYRVVA